MSVRFMLNETSYFGKGAREELAGEINKRGFKKVFLVSDKSLVDAGVTAKIETVLKNANIKYDLYDEIKPNPTIKNVIDGVEACKKSKADVIVAVGGGSSMDTAKGISIVMTNPERSDIKSLNGLSNTVNRGMPVIALPTTAGTAAEVTINYVITDEEIGEIYEKEIVPELVKEFGYTNKYAVPKLSKIVLNMGVGEAVSDKKKLDSAAADLTAIAAQKSVITHAKKSIATYRLREGQAIGTKVTLRGKRMYDFLDKLITVALPRVKDFRGLSKSKFDGRGNYAFGIKEHLIFPEISVDKIDAIRGMDIVIATTAKTDDEARALLTKIGLPLVLK